MKITDLLERLKLKCPSFATIEHALTSSADPNYPAAMLVPSAFKAAPSTLMGDVVRSQEMIQTFSIFILLERRQDSGLSSKADDLDDLTAELRQGLMGWQVDPYHAPMNYAGGQLDKYMTGIVCWREDFTVELDLRITFNG